MFKVGKHEGIHYEGAEGGFLKNHLVWMGNNPGYQFGLIAESEAVVNIDDRGFLYGDGLFETIRWKDGVICFTSHMERMRQGLQILGIKLKWTNDDFLLLMQMVARSNNIHDGYIRLSVTRGSGPRGFGIPELCKPMVVIQAREWNSTGRSGWKIVSSSWRVAMPPLSRVKSMSALDKVLAKTEAHAEQAQESIMLDSLGHVAEGTSTNIFMVYGNEIVTPSLEWGGLPGVARKSVIELAQKEGVSVSLRNIPHLDCFEADEIFLTNSLHGVIPVRRWDSKEWPEQGRMTEFIRTNYNNWIEKHITF